MLRGYFVRAEQKVFSRSLLARIGLTATLSVCLLVFAIGELQALDQDLIARALSDFAWSSWLLALCLTTMSFVALSGFDALAAGLMGSVSGARKRLSRVCWQATAIAQCVGFGPVTGTLARWYGWRNAPNPIPLKACFQLTCWASGMFFTGWLVVTNIVLLWQCLIIGTPGWEIPATALALTFGALLFLYRRGNTSRHRSLPKLRLLVEICIRAAFDTLGAAATIYVFLPGGYIDFSILYGAFLISYVAGMLSGLPGGVGAFEVIMLMMLPTHSAETLLAALVAFRMVYFILPALCAAILLYCRSQPQSPPNRLPAPTARAPETLSTALTPLAGLLPMGELLCQSTTHGSAGVLMRETRHLQIIYGSGMGPAVTVRTLLADLSDQARQAQLGQVVYKCDAPLRDALTQQGFMTAQVGQDTSIDLHEFDLCTPARRGLRRELRKAQKAGVEICAGLAPFLAMEEIDAQWRARNGRARGFSMGRFSQKLLLEQRVYCAYIRGILVGYATFLHNNRRWRLDLMRNGTDCPEGTMHSLVQHALQDAQNEDAVEFSLASVPGAGITHPRNLMEHLIRLTARKSTQCSSLTQFKDSFSPKWHPEFIAVSHPKYALQSLWVLFWLIHRPREIEQGHHITQPHDNYDNYEIASRNST